jgi:hypothetical protein
MWRRCSLVTPAVQLRFRELGSLSPEKLGFGCIGTSAVRRGWPNEVALCRITSSSLAAKLPAMPQFSFFIRNRRSQVKYPRSFDLPDLDAARLLAMPGTLCRRGHRLASLRIRFPLIREHEIAILQGDESVRAKGFGLNFARLGRFASHDGLGMTDHGLLAYGYLINHLDSATRDPRPSRIIPK